MSVELLLQEFERIADAPDAVKRLRRFVLDLAVRGSIVDAETGVRLTSAGGVLLPWNIPGSWSVVELASLAGSDGVFVDGDWVESKDQDPTGDVRLTQLADVGVGNFRNRSARYMRSDVAHRLNCTYLEPGDILIARMPDPIGRACMFPGDPMTCVTVVDVAILRTERPDVFPNYVIHALNSSLFATLILKKAAGTTRQRISRGNLGRLPFPLPPLEEQHRIVAKVDELMTLCDELEVVRDQRESRRNSLRGTSLRRLTARDADEQSVGESVRFFLERSPRMITRPDHVPALRQAILEIAVDGRLSASESDGPGRQTTFGDIGRWGSGGTPDKGHPEFYGGDIPWVVIGDLNESFVTDTASTLTEVGLRSSSAKMIEPGAVLIAMYGASVGKLGIAGVRCCTNQAIAHCIPDTTVIDRDYLWTVLRSMRAALVASGRGGAQPNISQTILKAWPLVVPPITEQHRIVKKVDELSALCSELERALASAQTERGRLLESLLHNVLNEDADPVGDNVGRSGIGQPAVRSGKMG